MENTVSVDQPAGDSIWRQLWMMDFFQYRKSDFIFFLKLKMLLACIAEDKQCLRLSYSVLIIQLSGLILMSYSKQ